jgi:amino-acid N-acetyltransferase
MSATVNRRPARAIAAKLLQEAELPASDLTDAHMEHFYFCGPASAPIGLVGLELCGQDVLMRSLVVAPNERFRGLGKQLVTHAENEARARGIRAIYILTTTAANFFGRRGYVEASRDLAPEAIRATKEFAGICPASSAFMVKWL